MKDTEISDASDEEGYIECGVPHPYEPRVTCTQPRGHQYEHVSFDLPMAGQW